MWTGYFTTSLILVFEFVSWSLCHTPGPAMQQILAERRLLQDLLGNESTYTPDLLPTTSGSPIQLTFGLSIQSVGELDEELKTLEVSVWIQLFWIDPLLTWSPDNYSGVHQLNIPNSRIWIPDVVPYVHPMNEYKPTAESFRVIVNYTGEVIFVPHYNMKLYCMEADFYNFPFDKVKCVTTFGSWSYNAQQVNITNSSIVFDKKEFAMSEFQIDAGNLRLERKETKYPCCPDLYVSIDVVIGLYRQSWHHQLFLTLPGGILGFMIPFVFLIPPYRTDRIVIIGLKIAAAVFFIAEHLGGVVPIHSSQVPRPVNYYIGLLVLDLFTFFWTVLMSNVWLHGAGTLNSPAGLKRFCIDFLGKFLFLPDQRPYRPMYQGHREGEDVPSEIIHDPNTDMISDMVSESGYQSGHTLSNLQLICLSLDRLIFLFLLGIISIMTASCFGQ